MKMRWMFSVKNHYLLNLVKDLREKFKKQLLKKFVVDLI